MQTRRQALVEVLTGTALGMVGSFCITLACMRWWPGDLFHKTAAATVLCTAWSIARGYVLRRTFARLHK
jgi:L-asparaginase II